MPESATKIVSITSIKININTNVSGTTADGSTFSFDTPSAVDVDETKIDATTLTALKTLAGIS
ncbi:MAG: hypothetical protein ABSC11_03490 [Smithella sp.]|jgi:hypothetical protein